MSHLSVSTECFICENIAKTHSDGKFQYVIIFSQTGEWAQLCEDCAHKESERELSIDSVFFQDEKGTLIKRTNF